MLITPLYDIHAKIEQLNSKYSERIYVEALNDGSLPQNSAPKAAVYSFLSFLSEQLFQHESMKGMLKGEKNMKRSITIALFVVFLLMVTCMLGFGSYLFVVRIMKATTVIDKVRYAYFLGLMVFVSIMSILISSLIFINKSKSLKQSYEMTNLFTEEPALNHLMNMQRVSDQNAKSLKVRGTCPLMGFFLKKNRMKDVKYTFASDDWPQTSRSSNCLEQNKAFNFTDKSSSLHLKNLLEEENIPCTSAIQGSKFHAVDPLYPDTVFHHPPVLLKKIEKYDAAKQYDTLDASMEYFDRLLQSTNDNQAASDRMNGYDMIKKQLNSSLTGSVMSRELLMASSNTSPQNMNFESFLAKVLNDTESVAAYYEPLSSSAYFFKNMEDVSFIYYVTESQSAPTLFVHPVSDQNIKIGSHSAEVKDPFSAIAGLGKKLNRKKVYLYNSEGAIHSSSDQSLGHKEVLDEWNQLDDIKWFYSCSLSNFTEHASRESTGLSDMYITLKDALVQHFLVNFANLGLEKDTSFIIELFSEMYETKQYNSIEQVILDVINDVSNTPLTLPKEQEETADTSYMSYNGFVKLLSNMNQKEFLHDFLYNLDMLRSSTNGLNTLNSKYINNYEVQKNTAFILEFVFILSSVTVSTEVARYGIESYLNYRCEEINYNYQNSILKESYNFDFEDDPEDVIRKKRSSFEKKKFELETRQADDKVNTLFKFMSILSLSVMGLAMMFAWMKRRNNDMKFKRYTMEQNGIAIVNISDLLFNNFIDNIVQKGHFIPVGEGFKDTGDHDELYYNLKKYAASSPEDPVNLPSGVSLSTQYHDMIRMLKAYKSTNSLVDSSLKKVQFPIFEFTLYLIILAGVVVLFLYVFYKIRPFDMLKKINIWKKIEELQRIDVDVDPKSYGFKCDDPAVLSSKKATSRMGILILALVILAVSVTFAIFLVKNSVKVRY